MAATVAPTVTQRAETKLMTAEEAAQLSTINRRFEVVRGVCIEMSPASALHGKVTSTLHFLIVSHVRKNRLGEVTAAETGFVLTRAPDTVRAADVGFISASRLSLTGIPETGFWPIAPDLAVEVVSPGDSSDDVQAKVEDYLSAGTRMVWVVYPKTRSVTVFRSLRDVKILRGEETLSGEDVLPGFECKVNEIFE
ncbi:MAG TPA: Uma2 family endonuclease [Anaerolineales bacterium]|nr:Uma2 family endonuclease [Anaerolineales bacterium]